MSLLPPNAQKINVDGSTVDFFQYEEEGKNCFYFDTSACSAPEPMINAMAGLQLLKKANDRLVMMNHTPPNGLFPRIQANYDFEMDDIDGVVKIVFSYKADSIPQTDFSKNTCG